MSRLEPTRRVGAAEAVWGLLAGLRLCLGDLRMRRKVAASLAVNAVAFLLFVAALLWGAFSLVDALVGGPPPPPDAGWIEATWGWLREGLGWLLRVALVVGTMLVAPPLFNLVASILLPVFHGPVWEAARRRAGGPSLAHAPGGFRVTAGVVATEVRRLVRFLGLTLLILPLNLVPGVGSVVYLAAQLLLAAHALGWDLLSYHFELHGLSYAEQKRWLRGQRSMVLAMGGVGTLLCTVPVAQLLFVTTNVAGGGLVSAWLDGAPRK
ncbi:MAG: EI24 domain-containing protein [Myxococcota bacterium]